MFGEKIENWRDLEKYGFDLLTGEACGISQRVLVDLKPSGLQNLRDLLSMNIQAGNNWNSGDGQIASAMLPWGFWRELAIFLLAQQYPRVVSVQYRSQAYTSSFVMGMSEEDWDRCKESYETRFPGSYRVFWRTGDRRGGMRNLHHMSGRIE